MANRTKVIETLKQYFDNKGRVLSVQEYSRETDTPIRIQQVRNIFGSWNKLEKLLMARELRTAPDVITDVNDVIAARNKALYEESKQWREASENQDAKALREAEAQHIAEVLANNAGTAQGANANKLAIGGPLPSEQQQLHRMGSGWSGCRPTPGRVRRARHIRIHERTGLIEGSWTRRDASTHIAGCP